MSWDDLQTKTWTRMSRGQYAWVGLPQDARLKLVAVAQRVPAGYAFSGLTAAWLLGLDVSWCEPIEVTIARDVPVRARVGVRLRRAALSESDVIKRLGLRMTSPLRTVCDLGSRRDAVESVVAVDMALHARLVELSRLERHVHAHPGEKGIKRLRRAVRLADPRSESPMETRIRLELIRARLPRPSVQAELRDSTGNFIGRADLYYPIADWSSSTTARITRTGWLRTFAGRMPSSTPDTTSSGSPAQTCERLDQSSRRCVGRAQC